MVTKIRKGARLHYYIREHMKTKGVSGDVMAGRIGVNSRSQVWKLCKEQQRLTPGKVLQIADALGMEPSELLYPPGVPSLDAIASDASPEQRDMAADVLRRVLGK